MKFYERLDDVVALLRQRGRVSYRALMREFDLDHGLVEDLKVELIDVHRLARDEGGTVLVWLGNETEAGPSPALPAPPVGAPAPAAERRQVTVMFCDLVRSTELAGQLDPEDLREILRAYQELADDVVRRYGGVIARYVGDGLLIYFGYPRAHEDDAPRAVRAGLEIVSAVGRLHVRLTATMPALARIPLRVRIGLHTGLAVMGRIGDRAGRDMEAVGETPNVAARVQRLAEPDTVLLTDATHRLLRDAFECEPLGAHSLRGIAGAITVLRAVREREPLEGSARATPAHLTPIVGRDREMRLLVERWTRAKDGQGHVVVVRGEAGIGKSRLVDALASHMGGEPSLRLEGRCSPQHQASALYPAAELLERTIGMARGQPPEERLARLEDMLRQVGLPIADTVPFLAAFLGLPLPVTRYPPLGLSPERHRQRTLETMLALVVEIAARQPLLLILEDLHWVDPTTLEWLGLLMDRAPTTRLLAVLTARPEFTPPWDDPVQITTVEVGRLHTGQVEDVIASVARGKPLPRAVIEHIVANTDGVPLFVEELTRMVLESGLLREEADRHALAGPLPPLAIPATLHDSLTARLDRLPSGKALAQLAAVIGRSFPYVLLQAASGIDDETLGRELATLVEAQLLYQQGVWPDATYSFKHALIQEAAYQALLKSTRQQYHARIAQTLEARVPEVVEMQPEVVAHHYTEAGLVTEALAYWRRAGDRAAQRSAYAESISHFTRALALVTRLPETSARAEQELALHLALGRPLVATRGHWAPEVERTYARAHESCRSAGDVKQVCQALFGLFTFSVVRAEFQRARELGEELLRLLETAEDPLALVAARRVLGTTLFFLGDIESAWEHADAGVAVYHRYPTPSDLYGREVGVYCQVYTAMTLQLLGHSDRAERAIAEARGLAQRLSHAFSEAIALTHSAWVHQFRGEPDAVRDWADAAIALSRAHGFPFYVALATILRGWALVKQGQGAQGLAEMHQALGDWGSFSSKALRPYFLALLAEGYADAGDGRRALGLLAESLALAEKTGEGWWVAEQHRLRGELLLEGPALHDAEACFRAAVDVARRQEAKWLELRAVTSLAKVCQRTGSTDEARARLAAACSGFTEGLDLPDLRAARTVLAAL